MQTSLRLLKPIINRELLQAISQSEQHKKQWVNLKTKENRVQWLLVDDGPLTFSLAIILLMSQTKYRVPQLDVVFHPSMEVSVVQLH